MKLSKLPRASSIYGAAMGRRSTVPANPSAPIRLRLVRLRWYDGDYDEGGAYWGNSGGTGIYRAHWDDGELTGDYFVRAASREIAKAKVREAVPGATFYR